jgi:CRP/FNR family transcriptional regulator, dissimilatory nitrate respiration regulator
MEVRILAGKLRQCQLFSHLDSRTMENYLNSSTYILKKYNAGQFIAGRGDRYENLLFLLSGTLSADIHDLQGRSLKVESLNAPETVAPGILFADNNRLPIQLSAVSNAVVVSVHRDEIMEMASKDREIMKKLLSDAGNRIQFLAGKLRYMRFGTIRQKLCNYLMEQSALQNNLEITLPYTIEVLSELFGVERPSLSRVISLLMKENSIRRERNRIIICDRERITDYCDQDE